MKKQQIREVLEGLGCTPKDTGRTGWVISDCPRYWEHKEGKSASEVLGVKIGSGDPFTNCFACAFHGTLGDLLVEVKYQNKFNPSGKTYDFKRCQEIIDKASDEFELDLDQPDVEELFLQGKKKETIFDEWWIQSFPLITDVDWAVEYWTDERGLPIDVATELGVRVDTKQKRVCFPVQDFVGKYRGFHGRAVLDDIEPRYRMYTYKGINNPDIWLGENWIDPSLPIIVVEGPFDLASVRRVYKNVTSPLFANPSIAKLKRMGHCLEWVTFYDHGTGGDKGRERVTEVMGKEHIVKHLQPPEHRKDPGACTMEEIAETLSEELKIDV